MGKKTPSNARSKHFRGNCEERLRAHLHTCDIDIFVIIIGITNAIRRKARKRSAIKEK